jgi:hypothetical protein
VLGMLMPTEMLAVWIVLFVETFVVSVQIEKIKLSHANLLRSEPGAFESGLHSTWKREFFEVPVSRLRA